MCGIVGLFIKRPEMEADLGAHLATMLATMGDRGPDSAGFAVYGADTGDVRLTVRAPRGTDFAALAASLDVTAVARDTHAVLHVPTDRLDTVRSRLLTLAPTVTLVGEGQRMELYKEVGAPEDVMRRFGLSSMAGTHGIGHTRMATESAVTIDGAHPYTTGADQCLVHNGSLSNHNEWRRTLTRAGMMFQTENDTEVAAAYLS